MTRRASHFKSNRQRKAAMANLHSASEPVPASKTSEGASLVQQVLHLHPEWKFRDHRRAAHQHHDRANQLGKLYSVAWDIAFERKYGREPTLPEFLSEQGKNLNHEESTLAGVVRDLHHSQQMAAAHAGAAETLRPSRKEALA
jgi:hypothetical protein